MACSKTDDLKICLHDIAGRVVLVKKESVKQGPNTIALPRITLSKGMYIVSVYYKEGRTVMKLMVQ